MICVRVEMPLEITLKAKVSKQNKKSTNTLLRRKINSCWSEETARSQGGRIMHKIIHPT